MAIRMIELFAGIGATREAIKNLGLDVEYIAISEIDKYAIMGYEAIHGKTLNLGDITKIERLPAADLITYSYPCQSLSIAGKQDGMKEGSGTTSSLVWEVGRLVKDLVSRGEPPAVLLMENVDAVLNKKNIGEFSKWVGLLSELGYTSSWKILNAKDYGTPQNRKRCFMVSARNGNKFLFPPACPDGRVLRDVLENNVSDSFYLNEDRLKTFIRHKERNDAKGNGFGFKIRDLNKPATSITTNPDRYCSNWVTGPELKLAGNIEMPGWSDLAKRVYLDSGISPALNTRGDASRGTKILYPCATKKGYTVAASGDGLVMSRPTKARGTVQQQSAPTLTCGAGCGTGTVDEKLRIRYLTPRECLRLQAFPENTINILIETIESKTQLYKLAGNSIPVCVLRAIFEAIYIKKSFSEEKDRQVSLKRWGVVCERFGN